MPGTNVWSVVFIVGVLVGLAILSQPLINMWRRYFKSCAKAIEAEIEPPSWSGPTATTVLVVGVCAVAITLGWNAMTSITASTTVRHVNPAAVQEQKKILESQLPGTQEFDQTRAEQRERQQIKPHKEALDSFDESMRREAEKIKKRSLDKPAVSPAK